MGILYKLLLWDVILEPPRHCDTVISEVAGHECP